MAEQGDFLTWFSQVNPCGYDLDLRSYEEKNAEPDLDDSRVRISSGPLAG